MNILSLDNLTVEGVTLIELQKSLTINCFGKNFGRKSDVPKKFKDKALDLSSEFLAKGIDSFVTETKFSYTVWQEIKENTIKTLPSPSVTEANKPSFSSNFSNYSIKSQSTKIEEDIKKENITREKSHYRKENITDEPIQQNNKKPRKKRTYRGVVY